MTGYVDVGVVRIQEYIMRTSGAEERQLARRRGASRMIANATDPGGFECLDLGLVRNDETYAVEGVAHLKAPMIGDSRTPPKHLEEIATAAMNKLRKDLPQAYLVGSWALADSYKVARGLMEQAREDGGMSLADAGVLESIPRFREDPYAARCRSCGLAPAATEGDCDDCHQREVAGRQTASAGTTTPESRAVDAVGKLLERAIDPAKDIRSLLRLVTDSEAKHNHMATVYADGNRVGSLFQSIDDPAMAARVSVTLDAAIRGAGAKALASLAPFCREGVLPGIVTLLAADDCLITVPGPLGWRFVRTLIETFNETMATDDVVRQAVGDGTLPTLTAGLAFTREKSPIEMAIQAAAEAMRSAKATHPGVSAVGWTDLTHPATDPAGTPLAASSVRLSWLDEHRDLLDACAALAGHQRAAWERDIGAGLRAGLEEGRVLAHVRRQIGRLGIQGVDLDGLVVADVQRMLNMVRWWSDPVRSADAIEDARP